MSEFGSPGKNSDSDTGDRLALLAGKSGDDVQLLDFERDLTLAGRSGDDVQLEDFECDRVDAVEEVRVEAEGTVGLPLSSEMKPLSTGF